MPADAEISDITELVTVANGDLIPIVDVSDTTGNAQGTTKYIQKSNLVTGTGDALTTNPLSQFAATTSAQLAGVISNETGSGLLVFGTLPTLLSPSLKSDASTIITGSIDPTASIAVTGVGTAFTTELSLGDAITVSGETRTVIVTSSATALRVNTAFSNNGNDTSVDRIPSAFKAVDQSGTQVFGVSSQGVGVLTGSNNPSLFFTATNTNYGYISLATTTFDIVANVTAINFRGTADLTFAPVAFSVSLGAGAVPITTRNYLGTDIGQILYTGAYSGQSVNMWEIRNVSETVLAAFGATANLAVAGATISDSTAFITPASTTTVSSARIPHGSAPTAPVNGDMWTTTAGLFVRINGATVGPLS